ncbi:MAG: TetR family transcriptional regulator [Labilithrix sp.]|nr:TetR family transcriptional regulator [Labilithrix sp.]
MFVNARKPRKSRPAAPEPERERPARRVPTQDRSRQRVERILDAAALVFAAQGHEAATMEAIAARAETSIGSIYQFYPNKAAVFDALVHRYHTRTRTFLDALLTGPLMDQPWPDILDAAIDAIAALHEDDPAFRAVWVSMHLTETMVTEGEALNRDIAARLAAVFGPKLPRLPPRKRGFVAMMVVELVSAMLILSARRPGEGKAIMAETKKLLRLYLTPWEQAAAAKGLGARRSKVRSHR